MKPNQREMFLAKGIPYDELDTQMINLIDILNFKIGLKTRHCCFGHKPYEEIKVMFEEEVNLRRSNFGISRISGERMERSSVKL